MYEEIKGNEVAEVVEAAPTKEIAGDQSKETQAEEKATAEKKYTDADLDRIIAKKIAAERKRISKLFNEEQQVSEIEQRERNVLLRELKADAKDSLIEQGLPSSLAGLLDYSDKETLERSITEVGTLFKEAVDKGVKDRLRGSTPRTGYSGIGSKEEALHKAFRP